MRAALLCKPPPKNPPPTQLHLRSLGVQRGCSNGSRISAMVGVSVVAVAAVGPQRAGGPMCARRVLVGCPLCTKTGAGGAPTAQHIIVFV